MWKITVLLLTLHSCGINAGNIYRNGWPHANQELVVNQPSYYSHYAPLLHDFASYQQKLQQQGLAPAYGSDLNPPFILNNNAAQNSYNPYQHNYNQGLYEQQHHNGPSYHHKKTTTHPPKTTVTTPKTTTTTQKGKHKFNHIVHKVDDKKKNESEHAKKPIVEIDIKWPHIKHDNLTDKKHANASIIVKGLNKIGDQVEVKVSAIKQFVDKSVDNINKTADGVYHQIGNESSKLIDKINKKLKAIERQLERLKFGSVKSIDDEFDENFEGIDDDDDGDAVRAIFDNQSSKPNFVHSEIGKKLRSLELLDMNAELRGDLKTSISDAVKNAQEKFNKLIDDQVAKINNKIIDITEKFEAAFQKFQDTLAKLPRPTVKPLPTKVYTPPTYKTTTSKPVRTTTQKYTTIVWKPKTTTPIPVITTKYFDKFTTPEYFKYTIPTPEYRQKSFASNDNTLLTDLNRMDANVDALEIVDNANDELPKSDDVAEVSKQIDNKLEANAEANPEAIIDLKSEVDTAKSLDDLQSQVLENVKDTLKSDDEALEAIENNQSEVLENPEDKLKSDTVEKATEEALAEELRNELSGDKLFNENVADEKSQIDNTPQPEKNSDDMTKNADEFDDDEYEATTTSQNSDDSVKLLEINDDGRIDIDGNEMRSLDEDDFEEASINIDEDFQLPQSNQAANFRFDELEVIQLIPVIIDQLKAGHVSKSERVSLEKVFGDLWSLIEAEAKRVEGEDMNPLLKTILQSEEVRLAKRDITKQIGNDIFKNSVRRVYRGDDEKAAKPYISLDDDRKLMSPSERLLNMVAAIVHKTNLMEKEKTKLRQKQKRKILRKKKDEKNPLGIVTVQKPRQRFMDRIFGINRMKRSLIKFSSDLADMRSLLEKVNQANESEEQDAVNEDDIEDEQEIDESYSMNDYVNDDYYYDDGYQISPPDTNDYLFNQLGWNSRRAYDDYENGSVNEFVQLSKQRDRREKNAAQGNLEDLYQDDDDDDDY